MFNFLLKKLREKKKVSSNLKQNQIKFSSPSNVLNETFFSITSFKFKGKHVRLLYLKKNKIFKRKKCLQRQF